MQCCRNACNLSCCFRKVSGPRLHKQLALNGRSYIFLDFSFAEESETRKEFEVQMLYFDMLFTNNVYI